MVLAWAIRLHPGSRDHPPARHRWHGGCDDVAVQLASGAEVDHRAAALM